MEQITINELIRNKRCLDTLYNGVHYELNDNIHVDTQDDTREGINALTLAILQVFYAWLRQNNIKIDTDKIKD